MCEPLLVNGANTRKSETSNKILDYLMKAQSQVKVNDPIFTAEAKAKPAEQPKEEDPFADIIKAHVNPEQSNMSLKEYRDKIYP